MSDRDRSQTTDIYSDDFRRRIQGSESKSPICPLLFLRSGPFGECRKERCAWWSSAMECCSIRVIAAAITSRA